MLDLIQKTSDDVSAANKGAKTIRARIEQSTKKVIARDGREVVSNTRLFLRPVAEDGTVFTPTVDDFYQLPTGFHPQTPTPMSVERSEDERGLCFWTVHL